MRVLIADDCAAIVESLSAMLAKVGGIDLVGRAGTVMDASRSIRELEPDVVILDIEMPGGSGLDVLAGLKRDRRSPVVIVLTNHPQPQYRERCLQGGARFFLDKSTEFQKIVEILGTLRDEAPA
jgi:DNA-binding NarL/FixJ family response regulator